MTTLQRFCPKCMARLYAVRDSNKAKPSEETAEAVKAFVAEAEDKKHKAFNYKSGVILAKCSSGELLDELMKRRDVWVFALRNDKLQDRELKSAIEDNEYDAGDPEDKIRELLFNEYEKPYKNK